MKYSEMNSRQKTVFRLIRDEYNFLVGGIENAIMDGQEKKVEPEEVIDIISREIKTRYPKDFRFVGNAFINERIVNMLKKDGYI